MKRIIDCKMIIGCLALFVCFIIVPKLAVAALCGTSATISLDVTSKDVLPDGYVDYTITITNNHTASCDIDLSVLGDEPNFTSTFPPDGNPSVITVANGATETATLRVAVSGQAIGSGPVNDTNLTVDDSIINVLTTVNNPLLHNSFNLNSSKWSGSSGWGVSTGKYGEMTCSSCHARNTGNIKRVVSSLPDAANTTPTNFPGAGQAVDFQSTTGANSFGDDSSIHATSNRICEVCHTYDATGADGVTVHAYNMPVTANHENNTDCISCHLHSTGFAASCSACHGDGGTGKIWPDEIDNNGGRIAYSDDQAGAHDNHILVISQDLYGLDLNGLIADPASTDKQKVICAFCHPNPGGGGHDTNGGGDSMVDMQAAGSFKMLTVGAGNYADDTGSNVYSYTEDNCSNLVCHNQIDTPDVTTDSSGWNNPPASVDCTLCHTANGGTLRHDTHVGAPNNQDCTECHVDNGSFSSGTTGVDHINGDVDFAWDNAGSYEATYGDSAVTYSGDTVYKNGNWGSCASVACHSNSTTPAWDSSGSGCALCHTDTQTTGAHEYHMVLDGGDFYAETGYNSTTTQYDFGCADCHAGDSHVNGTTTVTTHGFNSGSKTCSTASCHGFMEHDGVTYNTVTTPAWDGPGFTGDRCAGCHGNSPISAGHDEHQIGFHYDAVYSGFKDFLPVEDTDPKPIGLVNSATLDPYDTLRGHGGLLESDGSPNSTTMSCYVCHNDTVKQKANALAITQDGPGGETHAGCTDCHSDAGNAAVGDAALVIADKSKHVNGVRDVVFMREKVRSKAQVRDELLDVPELSINWERQNGYKAPDGSSYDESPTTLFNYVGGDGTYNTTTMYGYNATTMTCMISCHLWEDGRVDKYPVHWYENSRWNPDDSKHIMCIDCHTRLPK